VVVDEKIIMKCDKTKHNKTRTAKFNEQTTAADRRFKLKPKNQQKQKQKTNASYSCGLQGNRLGLKLAPQFN
jgi:hypothetical protein